MMNDDAIIRDDLNFPFESVTEMKQSILWGGEVGFIYQGEEYGIFRWEYDNLLFTHGDEEIAFKDVDSLLNYVLNGETLKDILMKAQIICRNI